MGIASATFQLEWLPVADNRIAPVRFADINFSGHLLLVGLVALPEQRTKQDSRQK
jgi:hypothetical protein